MAKRKGSEVLPDYILWSWSENKEGKHPVKVRVTYQRRRKYYQVLNHANEKLFLSPKEYGFLTSTPISKLRGPNRAKRQLMDGAVNDAIRAIQEATHNGKKPFLISEFERKYLGSENDRNFIAFFRKHIEIMAKRGQAGNVRTYQSAFSAFHEFNRGKDFDPMDLTVGKLETFDSWLRTPRMKSKSKKGERQMTKPLNETSIGIYMRCLRAVYNEMAMGDEYLKADYPFSVNAGRDKKYVIPISRGQKGTTLDKATLSAFIKGKVDGDESPANAMYRAKLIFLFSFFGQGINPVDIAHLKYKDITGQSVRFNRKKTVRTRSETREIEIPLLRQLEEIIVSLGNPKKHKEDFIFEVFDKEQNLSAKEFDDKVRQWVKVTNKWLKRYCRFNDIPEFSLYSARHTFASLSKTHLPVAQISKMLGHSRITTTQNYLGRFDQEENKKGLQKVFSSLN